MTDLQEPIINWQVKAGDSKAGFSEHRVLIIAQGRGSSESQKLIEDVQPNEVSALCGVGSMATRAYNRFRKYNKVNPVDIIVLKEATTGANDASAGIQVLGEAKENKTLDINIGDDEFNVSVLILKGDTEEKIAEKIVNAINDKFNNEKEGSLFSANVDDVDKTLAKVIFQIKGSIGNGLGVSIKNRVLGCEFEIIPFAGGSGAYDTDDVFENVSKRYQTVLFDSAMDFDKVEEWLETRFNMANTVKGGSGFIMMNGSLSELKNFALEKNSKTMTVFANCDEMKFNAIPILAVAEFGAKRALRLTYGAILGDLVVESQEAFGGVNKSSLPYHNTPIKYDEPKNQLSIEQVKDLNDAGLSLFVPGPIGAVLGTVVTLYKVDNTGIEDKTFKYLNAVDTSLAVQEYLFNNSQKEFGQTRATSGDLVAGVAMTNTLSVKAYLVGLYNDMVEMALVQGGQEAIKSFKKNMRVHLDTATGIYSVDAPVAIVSQFRGLNGVVAISYSFK